MWANFSDPEESWGVEESSFGKHRGGWNGRNKNVSQKKRIESSF